MGRKALNIKYIFVLLAALFFGGLLIYNLHGLFAYQHDGRTAQENSQIAQEMFADAVQNALVAAQNYEARPQNGGYHNLLAAARTLTNNPDIVAYIAIAGTNIGNFVVQGSDNEHYLSHDAHGNQNINGALFLDYRNSFDFSDQNTIIYGHNMRNQTMFHDLRHFVNQDFFEQNPMIIVVKDDQTLVYEIFAAFATSVDFYYIQVAFEGPNDFWFLINEISNRSVITTGINPTANDRILILSTCTNVREDTRFVVAARLRL